MVVGNEVSGPPGPLRETHKTCLLGSPPWVQTFRLAEVVFGTVALGNMAPKEPRRTDGTQLHVSVLLRVPGRPGP